MSTASWEIDREIAEIIMPSGRRDWFDMDRAWVPNGGLYSANSYEWCHIFDGGIECAKCGMDHILAEDEEFHDRKVTKEDGVDRLEFCTYEFTEVVHCDCGETLGGWEEDCAYCGKLTCNYGGNESGLFLQGYVEEGERDVLYSYDDLPIPEGLKPICGKCLDERYDLDEPAPWDGTPAGAQSGYYLTRKPDAWKMYEADVVVTMEVSVVITGEGRNEKEALRSAENRLQAMDLSEVAEMAGTYQLRGYGVKHGSGEIHHLREVAQEEEN